jgi:ferredoxin-fold anticodon binding domain-containing protein
MPSILQELVGKHVDIVTVSNTDFHDRGVLDAVDDNFVRIRKESGEELYIAFYHIRLIKEVQPHIRR